MSPASDANEVKSRPVGSRFLMPTLVVQSSQVFETRLRDGTEQTAYLYRFTMVGTSWRIEYFGCYHYGWDVGAVVYLKATIKSHSENWRCTKISRPVELSRGDVPLFG